MHPIKIVKHAANEANPKMIVRPNTHTKKIVRHNSNRIYPD